MYKNPTEEETEDASSHQEIKPNYIETQLSKDKRKECRDIVRTINEYGISQRQKLYIIWALSLELEDVEAMKRIVAAISSVQEGLVDSNNTGPSRLILDTQDALSLVKKKIIL